MKVTLNNSSYEEKAMTLIKNAEGFSNVVYTDTTGNQTIGYGFNLSNPFFSNIKDLQSITESHSDIILRSFLIAEVFPYVEISNKSLNNNQLAVIADMMYNLGVPQFNTFNSFINYLNNGNVEAAAADLVDTLWFKQVGLRGIRNCMNLIVNNNYLYLE